jgi:hypothetical protein
MINVDINTFQISLLEIIQKYGQTHFKNGKFAKFLGGLLAHRPESIQIIDNLIEKFFVSNTEFKVLFLTIVGG